MIKNWTVESPRNVASFPRLPTIQFLIACSMQRNTFRARILHFELGAVHLSLRKCFESPALGGRNYKIRPQAHSFDRGPLPPPLCQLSIPVYLVDTDVIQVIKWTRPSRLRFCILQVIKIWTVGRPGNEATKTEHASMASLTTSNTRLLG